MFSLNKLNLSIFSHKNNFKPAIFATEDEWFPIKCELEGWGVD